MPDSGLTWTLVLNHCSALVPTSCHEHTVQTFTGPGGPFTAPNHDYPAYLELKLTATDGALAAPSRRRLDPQDGQPDLRDPARPACGCRWEARSRRRPFTRTVIQGATVGLIAPAPQTLAGKTYDFSSWSDGGAAAHTITAPTTATPATYRANYSESVCAPAANLVGAWGFDETGGTTTADASGRGNTGTISGATRTTAGKFGSALTFDGVNDLVTVADSASLDLTNSATLEAWVNPTALGLGVAHRAAEGAGRPARLRALRQQRLQPPVRPPLHDRRPVRERHGAAAAEHVVAPGDDLGRHHAAAVRERRAGRGAAGERNAREQRRGAALRRQQRVGGVVRGPLDEIRVYDRALTQTELQSDMTAPVTCTGNPPPQPALSVSRTSMSFSATQGGANPAAQTFDVTNTGGGSLSYTASESASWLTVSPASGAAPGTVTATASIAGLAPGTYTAPITVTAAGPPARRRRST